MPSRLAREPPTRSADRRFAPAQPSCGGPHGVPSRARVTRTLREPGERVRESPLLHGFANSSSTARAAPSPQRERRTAPPPTSARRVPTRARRSASQDPRHPRRAAQRPTATARARARAAFAAVVRLRLHGGGVSGSGHTPAAPTGWTGGAHAGAEPSTRKSGPLWDRTALHASHAARGMPGRFFGSRASHRFGS